MALLTATEVTIYSSISATAGTITAQGLIPLVQDQIALVTNWYFETELYLSGMMTFNATAGTIAADSSFSDQNFVIGDDIRISNSYRNNGYFTVTDVSGSTLTVSESVTEELSGRSILVSVVKWPKSLKPIAAEMIAYDYDVRPSRTAGITSRTLGPWSESYGEALDQYGYPKRLTDRLIPYRVARLI